MIGEEVIWTATVSGGSGVLSYTFSDIDGIFQAQSTATVATKTYTTE